MTEPAAAPSRSTADRAVAFQGMPGAFSHLACRERLPELEPLPCHSFEDAFAAVHEGRARYAMIPIDNSVAGRVADVHHLLPRGGLHIVGEMFLRVKHHLLAPKGASLATVRTAESHVHAIGQCRRFLREHGLQPRIVADTAGAAADVARSGDLSRSAIASRLAAEIYGLEILGADIEDAPHNTTRFVLLALEPDWPAQGAGDCLTTFVFAVRNVPAALYKAMGGFATNGVNMTKLESYIDGSFTQAEFYADVMGHPADRSLALAFEELRFFARDVRVLGVYPADPFRERTA
jgi:prephenate dehydratase